MLTRKTKNRLVIFLVFVGLLAIFTAFLLKVLEDNVLYFFSPTEIQNKTDINFTKKIRIGGMVKEGSVKTDENEIKFIVTDLKNEIIVSYKGTVPNLFSEGKGVIAEGKLQDKNFFVARRILAKHDENYMPPKAEKGLDKNVK